VPAFRRAAAPDFCDRVAQVRSSPSIRACLVTPPLLTQGLARTSASTALICKRLVFPNVQGGFQRILVVGWPIAAGCRSERSRSRRAFGRPLAVELHAVARSGSLIGKAPRGGCGTNRRNDGRRRARPAGAGEMSPDRMHDAAPRKCAQVGPDRASTWRRRPRPASALFEGGQQSFDVMSEGRAVRRTLLAPSKVVRARGTIGRSARARKPRTDVDTGHQEIDLIGTFRCQAGNSHWR